jgi:translation initiation factor 3 subunit B
LLPRSLFFSIQKKKPTFPPNMASSSAHPASARKRELLAPSEYPTAQEELDAIEALLQEGPYQLQSPESPLSRTVVFDNLPLAPVAKKAMFETFLAKQVGTGFKVKAMHVPDDGHNTLGYAFVEFENAAVAAGAQEKWNGKLFDKKHKVVANMYADFNKYSTYSTEFIPPTFNTGAKNDFPGAWLLENHRSDQYAIRYGVETEIYWHEMNKKTDPIKAQREWTDNYGPEHPGFTWSPLGFYFVTFHNQGVILWGGPNWSRLHRFQHKNVFRIEFSPCEKYLITVSRQQDNKHNWHLHELIIWDVRAEIIVERFTLDPQKDKNWPIFKWSFDDKYLSRLSPSGFSVIDIASKTKIKDPITGKPRDVEIPGLIDFQWSPTQNIVAYAVAADANRPARIDLMELPSRKILQTRTAQNVDSISLFWHPQGDYLCAFLLRHSRSKRRFISTLDIFRIRQKMIPTDSLELADEIFSNDGVPQIAWEPRGTRFCVLHREQGSNARPNFSFYNVTADKVVLLKTLEKRPCTNVHWAPNGRFVVLAGLSQQAGHLEFFDSHDLELMAERDHFSATNCTWDPTGRYFVSYVTAQNQMENGYTIWSFFGNQILKVLRDRFYHFAWRPRPPSLLPASKLRQIKTKLKEYSDEYTKEDVRRRKENRRRFALERKKQRDEFYDLQADLRSYWGTLGFRPQAAGSSHWREYQEFEETVLDVKEEVVQD